MEKLELKQIRKPFSFHMNKDISVWVYLRDIFDKDYVLDMDVYLPSIGKNLQRPLVWTLHQKQQLILSVLKEIKIPNVSVIQWEDDLEHSKPISERKIVIKVIDGKQRISALIDFYQNKFPIEWEGKSYWYNDLDDWGQRAIWGYCVVGDVAYEYPDKMISDEEKIAWFERINFAGTSQDERHLASLKVKVG